MAISNKPRIKAKLTSPFGQVFFVEDVPSFSSINRLDAKGVYSLIAGTRKSHKGWTLKQVIK